MNKHYQQDGINALISTQLLKLRRHLRIVHHLPGRIRLRVSPALRDETDGLDAGELMDLVSNLEGIDDVRLNPLAGSLVVQYDVGRISPAVWETLVEGTDVEAVATIEVLIGLFSDNND